MDRVLDGTVFLLAKKLVPQCEGNKAKDAKVGHEPGGPAEPGAVIQIAELLDQRVKMGVLQRHVVEGLGDGRVVLSSIGSGRAVVVHPLVKVFVDWLEQQRSREETKRNGQHAQVFKQATDHYTPGGIRGIVKQNPETATAHEREAEEDGEKPAVGERRPRS